MRHRTENGTPLLGPHLVGMTDTRREQERAYVLAALVNAVRTAEAFHDDWWQFAVECEHFLAQGISVTTLRAVVREGAARLAVETTKDASSRRTFRMLRSLAVRPRACLVLTAASAGEGERSLESLGLRPRWDRKARTLLVGNTVVKRFRVPATSQEVVLDAFEEEGWPVCLDDPLPPATGQDDKERLHNTINALNRGHQAVLIRFFGNGKGQGVRWEWVQEPMLPPASIPARIQVPARGQRKG